MSLALYLNYDIYSKQETEKPVVIDIKEVARQTGLDSYRTSVTLDSLIDYNIVGSAILDITLGKKKITRGLNKKFIKSLEDNQREKPLTNAIRRTNYYIKDDSKVYVLNPDILTWTYPTWRKISKVIRGFKGKIDLEIIQHLIKLNKEDKLNKRSNKKEELNAPKLLSLFIKKFEDAYGRQYTPNWTIETSKMKNLILQFERNSVVKEEIPDFLDWAFNKIYNQNKVLNTYFLRSLANEYLVNRGVGKESKYVIDENGNRKLKGGITNED